MSNRFAKITGDLLKQPLPLAAFKVLCRIILDCHGKGYCETGAGTLASQTALGRRAVQRALDCLESDGWIEIQVREFTMSKITLCSVESKLASTQRGGSVEVTLGGSSQETRGVASERRGKDLELKELTTTERADSVRKRTGAPNIHEGFKISEAFRSWYQSRYNRPHAQATKSQAARLMQLLRPVAANGNGVKELARSAAADNFISACEVTFRASPPPWFIRDGPLTLEVVLKHWTDVWDRYVQKGQKLGIVAS